jgi:hypothetical protein
MHTGREIMSVLMRILALAATWALIYALPAIPIEGLSNLGIDFPFTNAVDMWPMELGLPGLVAGVMYGTMLAMSGRLNRFEHLPAGVSAGLGAIAGLLVGGLYTWTVWPESAVTVTTIVGIAVGLGALAGPGSTIAFRTIARLRQVPGARARA